MGLFSPFFKAQPHAIRGPVFCNIILYFLTAGSLLKYRLERSCQSSDSPFHLAGELSSAPALCSPPRVPLAVSRCLLEKDRLPRLPHASIPTVRPGARQESDQEPEAQLWSRQKAHDSTRQAPQPLPSPAGCGVTSTRMRKAPVLALIEPNTHWHLSYNSTSLQQQSLVLKPAEIVWGKAGNKPGPVKARYPQRCDWQNRLQASSGREMQKGFKTKLHYLGSKMGDA